MKFHTRGRLFVAAAVLGVVAVFAVGFLIAVGVRSVVAGPSADPVKPNPGHEWSEIGLPVGVWSGLDADTVDGDHLIDLKGPDDDWEYQANSPNMYSIPDGNVGIGTSDPTTKLHVVSDVIGGTAVLGEGYYGVSGQGAIGVAGSGAWWAGYFDGNGYFSGNVGIGTTAPSTKLHVVSGEIGGTAVLADGYTAVSAQGGGIGVDASGGQWAGYFDGNVQVVNGYVQLDLTTGSPPAPHCSVADHYGRMKFDPAAGVLWICGTTGWVSIP